MLHKAVALEQAAIRLVAQIMIRLQATQASAVIHLQVIQASVAIRSATMEAIRLAAARHLLTTHSVMEKTISVQQAVLANRMLESLSLSLTMTTRRLSST